MLMTVGWMDGCCRCCCLVSASVCVVHNNAHARTPQQQKRTHLSDSQNNVSQSIFSTDLFPAVPNRQIVFFFSSISRAFPLRLGLLRGLVSDDQPHNATACQTPWRTARAFARDRLSSGLFCLPTVLTLCALKTGLHRSACCLGGSRVSTPRHSHAHARPHNNPLL